MKFRIDITTSKNSSMKAWKAYFKNTLGDFVCIGGDVDFTTNDAIDTAKDRIEKFIKNIGISFNDACIEVCT